LGYHTAAAEIKGLIETDAIALAESLSTESNTIDTVVEVGLKYADRSSDKVIAALVASAADLSTQGR